ncbi:ATP synthase subunit I [Clostridium sp. A1-XYC3]|uniref:ATP synthase subunit I n=1 Tax=Clostridium tanneri TaxID=3037988 RepID=A0ABU4JR75_9CLOT|nr:ATP synthase subunit I [Clostridium sp. A1-XYC3]MDW8800657.1 ATP synthase subunit I [Clostridium sp. A1-XYC3]
MKNDLRDMFKKVTLFDALLVAILYWTTNIFFRNYSLIVILGLLVAYSTFIFNGLLTQYVLSNKKDKYQLVNLLGFIVRVAIVCGIAIAIFNHNKFNVIAYMFGYSAQFVSLILYGLSKDTDN